MNNLNGYELEFGLGLTPNGSDVCFRVRARLVGWLGCGQDSGPWPKGNRKLLFPLFKPFKNLNCFDSN
jgi:hypothetical protein